MSITGKNIQTIRNQKSLSQAQLAEQARISVRTLQRIESQETIPRPSTIQLICDALGIQPEKLNDFGKQENRDFLMYFHLSALLGLFFPFGNVLLPFVLWVQNKDKILGLDLIGRRLMAFQLFLTITFYILILLGAILKINGNVLLNFEPFYAGAISGNTLLFLGLFGPVLCLPIVLFYAYRAKQGKTSLYPKVLPFTK